MRKVDQNGASEAYVWDDEHNFYHAMEDSDSLIAKEEDVQNLMENVMWNDDGQMELENTRAELGPNWTA